MQMPGTNWASADEAAGLASFCLAGLGLARRDIPIKVGALLVYLPRADGWVGGLVGWWVGGLVVVGC